MLDKTNGHLSIFWEMTDEILNALLFVFMGQGVVVLTFTRGYLRATFLAIPVVLADCFFGVDLPTSLFRLRRIFPPYTVRVMVWSGLRGGISFALATFLAEQPERDLIIALTYGVVIYSVLVQGLTIGRVAQMSKPGRMASKADFMAYLMNLLTLGS